MLISTSVDITSMSSTLTKRAYESIIAKNSNPYQTSIIGNTY